MNYQIKLITSVADLDLVRALWESTQWHPMAGYDLFCLVIQFRSNIDSPCVIAILRDEEPIALLVGRIERVNLPVRFGYTTLADISAKQLVFIAGGYMGERTEANWKRLLAFMNNLVPSQKIDLVNFECFGIGSSELQSATKVFNRIRFRQTKEASRHWFLSLPVTWEEFLKGRSTKHRYWLRRLPAVLDREFGGHWKIELYDSLDRVGEFVHAAEEVAHATYQRVLGVGFGSDEETLQRIEMDAKADRLRGYVLFIRNEPKAFWYCFKFGKVLYLAATGYDPDYRHYELGTVLLMKVFQDHCGTVIDVVDFGPGDADYKRRFGSNHIEETSYNFFSNTPRGLFLNGLYCAIASFNRLASKLLDRLRMTQRVKTFWRQRLVKSNTKKLDSV